MVALGVDRVLRDPGAFPAWVASGRALGLLTSQGSPPGPNAPGSGASTVRQSLLNAGVRLARLFSPEHGLTAAAADGTPVPDGVDPLTGLSVTSLYGPTLAPSAESLRGLDGVLVDLQDVGVRFYTFIWTLSHLMEACAETGIPLAVLDRPNPLGGRLEAVEGPLPDPDLPPSFLSRWPVPIRHSLTMGEMARLLKAEMAPTLELDVVAMEGWRRTMLWPHTNLPFHPPSPGLPAYPSVLLYPGLALLEATNLHQGRGTPLAFQWFGAPWMEEEGVVESIQALNIPGLACEARVLEVPGEGPAPVHPSPPDPDRSPPGSAPTPTAPCPGVRLRVTAPEVYRPVAAGLQILSTLRTLFPRDFSWRPYPTAANPVGVGHLLHLLRSRGLVRLLEENPEGLRDPAHAAGFLATPGWQARVGPHLLYP